MKTKYKKFVEGLGNKKIKILEPLSLHTTFKIGGAADVYFEAEKASELEKAVKIAHKLGIPFFVLGRGSNILVSDEGYRGLVIKSGIKTLKVLKAFPPRSFQKFHIGRPRYEDVNKKFLEFSDLNYPDPPWDTKVLVGSGVSLAYLINWSLARGLTGLEWFSGIPSSIGGAVYNNIHGGNRLFLSRVDKIHLLTREGKKKQVKISNLRADYDYTALQKTGEVIVAVEMLLSSQGDQELAKKVAKIWRERKAKVQPQSNCPGCIFKNISEGERKKIGWPTTSAGYIFDKLLGWKGKVGVGKASLSEKHGNFIVNQGGATAKDVIELMKKMQLEVKKRYGIHLKPEIFFVGFSGKPIKYR